MEGGGPLTTSSSSGSGAPSNGSTSFCASIARSENCGAGSSTTLNTTTTSAGIRHLPISRLRRYMNDDQENGKERGQTGNRTPFSFSKFIVKKLPSVVLRMGSTSLLTTDSSPQRFFALFPPESRIA